ncbi:MAG: glycoside hydrolase family 43 protein, partial [Muribaculaceae bacterium]|nr:glycoside hydrolase family 43 protein [Muribaculaceae bacterium]
LTLRAPATDLYSLESTPGCLALTLADTDATEKGTPAYVGRRLQHHVFSASTEMTFLPDSVAQAAGLLVFKNETHQYFLGRGLDAEGADVVFLDKISPEGVQTMAETSVDRAKATISLKVDSTDGLTYNFYVSTDDGKTYTAVAEGVDARHTSTAAAGGFTGTTVGPYAINTRHI